MATNQDITWVEKILKKPHIIISFLALFIFMGLGGFNKIHRNLFPNSNYPEVAVVVVEPGASAKVWLVISLYQLKRSYIH